MSKAEGPTNSIGQGIMASLAEQITEHCLAEEISGNLVCKKCKHHITIDFFEMNLTCTGCDEL